MDVPEITRHIFTCMKALRTSVREKMDTLDRDAGMSADGTAFAWTVYGMKQLTIDPTGMLRAIRRADEREILLTARLLRASHYRQCRQAACSDRARVLSQPTRGARRRAEVASERTPRTGDTGIRGGGRDRAAVARRGCPLDLCTIKDTRYGA